MDETLTHAHCPHCKGFRPVKVSPTEIIDIEPTIISEFKGRKLHCRDCGKFISTFGSLTQRAIVAAAGSQIEVF